MIRINVVAKTPNEKLVAWADVHVRSGSQIITEIYDGMTNYEKWVEFTNEKDAQRFREVWWFIGR